MTTAITSIVSVGALSAREEAVQHARSYALEAERKMGEMLKEKPAAKRQKAGPGRGKKTKTPSRENSSVQDAPLFSDDTPTLADLGITGHESKAAQFLADLPRPVFDAVKVRHGPKGTVAGVRYTRCEQCRQRVHLNIS